jgi:5-methylcytosine-specific restriction endonuclease McrA
MTNEPTINGGLSDTELLDEVKRLIAYERLATARLIAALAELDVRKLYVGEGCSSLFTYCTQVLHLSEHAAYLRIEAARAARKWPAILDLLADGALHLTAISLLSPHLTTDNQQSVLEAARHKSKREVEEIVASLRPQPAIAASMRKLPPPRATTPMVEKAPSSERGVALQEPRTPVAEVKVLAPERYKVQFTISRDTHDQLREAQHLLRHCIPDGAIGAIFERAIVALLKELRRTKHAAVDRPRATSHCGAGRHVPAAVKRAVWERDGGRCAFVGAVGRCTERGFLEYHHRIPYAHGGPTTLDNLELRCRAHNAYEAQRWFGAYEDDLIRERQAVF